MDMALNQSVELAHNKITDVFPPIVVAGRDDNLVIMDNHEGWQVVSTMMQESPDIHEMREDYPTGTLLALVEVHDEAHPFEPPIGLALAFKLPESHAQAHEQGGRNDKGEDSHGQLWPVIALERLITLARDLSSDDDNPEYDRALVELITQYSDASLPDNAPLVAAAIGVRPSLKY